MKIVSKTESLAVGPLTAAQDRILRFLCLLGVEFVFLLGVFSAPQALAQGRPPLFILQPTNQIVVAGSDVTFSVSMGPSVTPLRFHWQKDGVTIAGATNASLTLTNVPLSAGGRYSVNVANAAAPAGLNSDTAGLTVVQDASISASLGGNPTLQVTSSGPPPLSYQWRFNGADIPGATTNIYVLTNAQPAHVGQYSVVASNPAGTVTIIVAPLVVDPTFTKITSGDVVSDGNSTNAVWGDLDSDGYLDLVVLLLNSPPVLYHNNHDGTFTRMPSPGSFPTLDVTNGVVAATLGDFNNDGYLDLLVGQGHGLNSGLLVLLKNNGDGTFTNAAQASGVMHGLVSSSGGLGWVDYNNDGRLDAFVGSSSYESNSVVFQNNGDDSFSPVAITGIPGLSQVCGAPWADYDNDGYADLAALTGIWSPSLLYHNNGDGTFTPITDRPVSQPQRYPNSFGCAWGDYDNDGFPDLFISNGAQGHPDMNYLYHNEGNGRFSQVKQGSLVQTPMASRGACWGDYDNDGFLDLLVINVPRAGSTSTTNAVYHNNGDGTFTTVSLGSLTSDLGAYAAGGWADYDNDGFLDLFVANSKGKNVLYRNNGNSNSWVKVQCVGTTSNRAGIGAKVRVKAFYRGASRWQLREIFGGDSVVNSQPLLAHFGLGDATNIDVVRIEWPSGVVQELQDVAPKQFLTVTELNRTVTIASASVLPNGAFHLLLSEKGNQPLAVEASTNLLQWNVLTNLATGSVEFDDRDAIKYQQRFYRTRGP